jgi:putative ABC transport system permease protein
VTVRDLLLRTRALLRPRQVERELDEELAFHIEREAQQHVAAGLSREEALARARARFGPVPLVADRCRDARGTALTDALGRDVRLAWRRLSRSPAFTLFAVATLAAGIGMTTAVYAGMHAFVLRDLGVPNPDALLAIGSSHFGPALVSSNDYRALDGQTTVFASLAASARLTSSLSADGRAELVKVTAVTGTWFTTVGVNPGHGRLIQPADDGPGAPFVAVLSDSIWRNQFAGDPDIVGKTVRMAGQAFEVIGVGARGFMGLDVRDLGMVWIPAAAAHVMDLEGGRRAARDPDQPWLTVIGRLKPGMSTTDAARDLHVVATRLDAAGSPANSTPQRPGPSGTGRAGTWRPTSALFRAVGAASIGSWLIVAMPALVLLVACTNLANLVLSRGVGRRHEYAVRLALGASQGALVRAHLVEHLMVAVAGIAGGLLVAHAMVTGIEGVFSYLPRMVLPDVQLDPWVVAASALSGLLSLGVFGLAPGLRLTQQRGRTSLSAIGLEATQARWKGRSTLVAWQVAVSVGLFLVMAVTLRLPYVTHAGDDLDLARVAVGLIPLQAQQYAADRTQGTIDRIASLLRESPAVSGVGWLSGLSVGGASDTWADIVPGDTATRPTPGAYVEFASPNALRTLGVPMRSGREFDGRDGPADPVIVIDEVLAHQLFGSVDVVGRQVRARIYAVATDSAERASRPVTAFTVVGVAARTINDGFGPRPVVYRPFAAGNPPHLVAVVARARIGNASSAVTALRTAVGRADPELATSVVAPADFVLRPERSMGESLIGFCGSMATLALVLCMTGLYGVLSHVIACRTTEFGVRAALGATRGDIVGLVLRDGSRPVLKGLGIALFVATAVRLLIQTQETVVISPFDPFALAVAVVPVAIAAAIACYLPARRASRLEPNVALRDL